MMTLFRTVILAAVFVFPSASSADSDGAGGESQKAVLVTGASTGIGRKMTELLAAEGYFVYAGARKQQDMESLNAIDNVQAVRLDVTRPDEIEAAVEAVKAGGRGLYGLINNAGVGMHAPLIEVDLDELKWLFDINVYGVIRVTQAFAPLVIESKGRITTTGSIAGIITGTFYGPYSMTKHAIEAYTDALAEEMERFDVKVSVIEPGSYQSEIGKNRRKRHGTFDEAKQKSPYAEEYKSRYEPPGESDQGKEPDEVAQAALHFLSADDPKRRYLVTPNPGQAGWVLSSSVQKLLQLNENHPYSLSRDQLVEMLDKAMGDKPAE